MSFKLFKAMQRFSEKGLGPSYFVKKVILNALYVGKFDERVSESDIPALKGPGYTAINFVNSLNKKIPLTIRFSQKEGTMKGVALHVGRHLLRLDKEDARLVYEHAEKIGTKTPEGTAYHEIVIPKHLLAGWSPVERRGGKIADIVIDDGHWSKLEKFARIGDFFHRLKHALYYFGGKTDRKTFLKMSDFKNLEAAVKYFQSHEKLLRKIAGARTDKEVADHLRDSFHLGARTTHEYGSKIFSMMEEGKRIGNPIERVLKGFGVLK